MKERISINGKRIEKYFRTKEEAFVWKQNMIEKHSDKNIPGESWKFIPNFNRYQASNLGRIRSINYKNSGLIKVLIPSMAKDGYLKTMLLNDYGKYKSWTVHKFITRAFYGLIPVNKEINHKDGNKLNNAIINLEYCTHAENCKHACDNGLWTIRRGNLNGMAKLTKEQVIKARLAKKENGRYWGRNEMAKEFGISAKHLQKIVNSKTSWTNV